MAAIVEPNYSLGQPVEIGRIERELKKLWEQGEGAMTRASLMNLAVYSEAPDSLERNTQIIAEVTQDHACRAIVICADVAATDNNVAAWISAHCHMNRRGAKQICSEQVSIMLSGASATLLPSILFGQLDSDLPLYLWWQAQMPPVIDPQLWHWVDRLIYDSRSWDNFGSQMTQVEAARRETDEQLVLCDLNWTRIVDLRNAFAQFFDHPSSHHHFAEIAELSIDFAAGYRSTALLFVGWIAAQLNWTTTTGGEMPSFKNSEGREIRVRLQESLVQSIGAVRMTSRGVEFGVSRAECGDLLEVGRGKPGAVIRSQLLPAIPENPVRLVSEELMRGGPRRVYLRAVERVRDLL